MSLTLLFLITMLTRKDLSNPLDQVLDMRRNRKNAYRNVVATLKNEYTKKKKIVHRG